MLLSRRLFLSGAIATIGGQLLPAHAGLPIVYGDGIHDDWAGIDALWNGRPARILAETVTVSPSGKIEMRAGNFLLSKTLHVRETGPILKIGNSHLKWIAPVDYCISLDRLARIEFGGPLAIDGSSVAGTAFHMNIWPTPSDP